MTRVVSVLLVFLTFSPGAFAQQKKRIAILNFDYGTVRNYVTQIFGGDQDIGKGIADLMVEKLVRDGTYSVIERAALDKVLAEQNFSNSDRADSTTAAKIGRVLGVDAIVVGTITQFGRDDKSTGIGGAAAGSILGKYGFGGVGTKKSKAVVGITARMISTDTAEILAAATGSGQSTRSGVSLLGSGGSAGGYGAGNFDMTSSNFHETILGEAVHQAVDSVVKQLEQDATKIPAKQVQIEGLVADATGNSLVLNVGSRAGVKVGDRLEVRRKVRDIKDPATGKVIRSIEDKVGEVAITEVDDLSSVGTFSGSSAAKVGDKVTNAQ
jgi:curli biogenesis system outer membrane secretion channel CsgG